MDLLAHQRSVMSLHGALTKFFRRCVLVVLMACFLAHNEAVTSESLLEENGIDITHQGLQVGEDATLNCTVKDLGRRRIIWSRLSDPYPISVGSTRFTPSKKYRVSARGSSCTLIIKKLAVEDAGEYQCRASGAVYLASTLTINMQGRSAYLQPTEILIHASVKDKVLLPCHVENIGDRLVMWKNYKNDLLSLRKKVYSGDRRMRVVHDTKVQWSLQIEDIDESDFGLYTCLVNSDPVLTRTVELRNTAPVETAPLLLEDTSFRQKVEVELGDTVTITCNFQANPPAEVTWYRRIPAYGGKTKKQEVGKGNSYTLQSVSPGQAGNYVCFGRNGIEPAGKGKTRLIIKSPPTAPTTTIDPSSFVPTKPVAPMVYHTDGQKRIGQRRGRHAQIKCTAIGLPRPSIYWTRYGKTIENDAKYKIEEHSTGLHAVHSKLLVRTLAHRDKGIYKCHARNTLGLTHADFEIYET